MDSNEMLGHYLFDILTFFKVPQLKVSWVSNTISPAPLEDPDLKALTKPLLTDYHGKSDFSDHLEKNGVKSPSMTT